MGRRVISSVVGVAVSAAAVVMAALASPASAAVPGGWIDAGAGIAASSACQVRLQSSRLSADSPAYVSALEFAEGQPDTCTAELERSHDGGKTWSAVSAKVTLPPVPAPFSGMAVTTAAYDGPGYLARACVKSSLAAASCTSAVSAGAGAVSAGAGAGIPLSPAIPASYPGPGTSAGSGSRFCNVGLWTTTTKKAATSSVDAVLESRGALCVAWIQVSANKGKTWTTVSAHEGFRGTRANPVVEGFLAPHRIGTVTTLARVCAQVPAVSAKAICSRSW
jgi:hypothetical protein